MHKVSLGQWLHEKHHCKLQQVMHTGCMYIGQLLKKANYVHIGMS